MRNEWKLFMVWSHGAVATLVLWVVAYRPDYPVWLLVMDAGLSAWNYRSMILWSIWWLDDSQ